MERPSRANRERLPTLRRPVPHIGRRPADVRRQPAGRRGIAEATVKVHAGRVLAQLGLRDWAQVVVYAYDGR